MRRFYTHLLERRLIAHQQNTLHCFEGLRAIRQRFRSADVPARVDAGCTGEHVEGSCYALKAKWQACPEGSDGVARMAQEQRADERASVLSSRFLVLGSQFSVPGSWFSVPGSQFLVPGSRFSVLSSWFSVLDTRQSISTSASSSNAAAP